MTVFVHLKLLTVPAPSLWVVKDRNDVLCCHEDFGYAYAFDSKAEAEKAARHLVNLAGCPAEVKYVPLSEHKLPQRVCRLIGLNA